MGLMKLGSSQGGYYFVAASYISAVNQRVKCWKRIRSRAEQAELTECYFLVLKWAQSNKGLKKTEMEKVYVCRSPPYLIRKDSHPP